MMRVSECRACKAKIGFIKTTAGKTMPVDIFSEYFIPDQDGDNLYVKIDGVVTRGRPVEKTTATAMDPAVQIGYKSHFATCPSADQFRKPRKKDRKRAD